MAIESSIEWTDATWNPVRGCTKISPGCKHCYAETFAERFRGVKGHPYEHGFDPRLVPEKLAEPLRWRQPKMIFVNSMSDLFHDFVPDDYIEAVATVMAKANWHTYQVLTKRSDRLRNLLNSKLRFAAQQPHIWWGVSVEDKKYGVPRIAHLQAASAEIRFLSVEPLLEDVGQLDLQGIDWMIVGGESGAGARPMQEDWVLSLRNQCRKNKVAFFFKQWGGVRKAKTGRRLQGRTYDEFPARVAHPVMGADWCAMAANEIESRFNPKTISISSLLRLPRPVLV
jgi:protein gp37